nr:type I restriction-modification enzyme R subunit C-terminal domain-containing protein [Thiohalocapsa halophila]
MLKDQIRQTLRRQFSSLDDFLRRWTASERKQAIIEALRDQGLPLAALAQAVPNGEALDAFDLISSPTSPSTNPRSVVGSGRSRCASATTSASTATRPRR